MDRRGRAERGLARRSDGRARVCARTGGNSPAPSCARLRWFGHAETLSAHAVGSPTTMKEAQPRTLFAPVQFEHLVYGQGCRARCALYERRSALHPQKHAQPGFVQAHGRWQQQRVFGARFCPDDNTALQSPSGARYVRVLGFARARVRYRSPAHGTTDNMAWTAAAPRCGALPAVRRSLCYVGG
jgi:hypothetical protein